MTTIIAGRFQQQAEVEDAMEELLRAGFARDQISSFYVNPAGQHDIYPIGGDRALSPGAKETGKGVAAGAAAGAVLGVAATPFLGPVGAVTGGLVGSLSQMKEKGEIGEHAEDADNSAPIRVSGMLVAVGVAEQEQEDRAIHLLRSLGAADIERAQGAIADGDWNDFNPLEPPSLICQTPDQPQASGPQQRT